MWSKMFSSIPEDLQPTASLVKSTVLASKADSTVRTYLGGFKRWKRWASSNHVYHFPANPFQVAVCLQCLLILLLQFLTRSTALIGRNRWLAYQKSPIIPWFVQWSVHLKGFWVGQRSKKILLLLRC